MKLLQDHNREFHVGDYIWLNRRWDDDEPPVLRVRRVRHRRELGVAEEIARRSGAYFLRPSTSDQLRKMLAGALVLPRSSQWNDLVCRLDERGDTRLALLVRHYVDSGCDADLTIEPEMAPDEAAKANSKPDVMDFLQLINGDRG
ncbi:hypothetical protein [Actinomadura sp. HBU206391]|uniref:hypothetical protein n=1 Tax=Actinomadura sp. HBU206391 TaxID=2731692 RepID=UPI001C9D624A|nr:hypothetical protein [Actinomadura sp. HBU206391]